MRPSVAFVLDIDGCVKKGRIVLDAGLHAVQRLFHERVPFVFLTNGGGVPEQKRAQDLSRDFGVPIGPEQVILSHTPLLSSWRIDGKDEKVLFLGSGDVPSVLSSYGLVEQAVWSHQLHALVPDLYLLAPPLMDRSSLPPWMLSSDPFSWRFSRIVLVHDSVHMGLELQLALDVMKNGGFLVPHKGPGNVAFYNTNGDLEYSSSFPSPRIAQASFVRALQALATSLYPGEIDVQTLSNPLFQSGKPCLPTYRFAEEALRRQAAGRPIARFFGVGDVCFLLCMYVFLACSRSASGRPSDNMTRPFERKVDDETARFEIEACCSD